MSYRSRSHLLIAALLGLTLVISAASVAAYFKTFPPRFRGWGEVAARRTIAGWVVDKAEPSRRVEVQLYIDGAFAASGIADLSRPDVVSAGLAADERCGYGFEIPALAKGEHVARVYAVHEVGSGNYRTLQLTGDPLRFAVDVNGKVSTPESSHTR